jgi:hypothetical protein
VSAPEEPLQQFDIVLKLFVAGGHAFNPSSLGHAAVPAMDTNMSLRIPKRSTRRGTGAGGSWITAGLFLLYVVAAITWSSSAFSSSDSSGTVKRAK